MTQKFVIKFHKFITFVIFIATIYSHLGSRGQIKMSVLKRNAKRLAGFDAPTVWGEFTPLANKFQAVNLGQGLKKIFTCNRVQFLYIVVIRRFS